MSVPGAVGSAIAAGDQPGQPAIVIYVTKMTPQVQAATPKDVEGTPVKLIESGEIVGSGRAEHSVVGRDGARETDPEEWWNALASALDQTGCKDEIEAISIGAQQHGLPPDQKKRGRKADYHRFHQET